MELPDGYIEGQKVKKLVKLNDADFRRARRDNANPIFLYMFGAYWCGHCKRLIKVLEATAPQVTGRVAVGKIDCTEEKRLCDEFGIRAYPTLKYSVDGVMYDYTYGRSEEELLNFAERMSRPVMTIVDSVDQANKFTQDQTFGHGVSFVCHDPRASKTLSANPASTMTVEQLATASFIFHICKQAARKELAHAYFSALTSRVDTSSITGVPTIVDEPPPPVHRHHHHGHHGGDDGDMDLDTPPTPSTPKKGGFVCRLEAGVPSRCLLEQHATIDLDKVVDFVRVNNVATLTEFGPVNFHRIGRLGRPLVIGVVDTSGGMAEEPTENLKKELETFAITGPARLTNEKYYFGWMDGIRWATFLKEFDIKSTELPQVFVLDVQRRLYWQDAGYKSKSLQAFLTAIDDGYVRPRESGGYRSVASYIPWTLIIILGAAVGAAFVLMPDAKNMGKKKGGGGGGGASQQPMDPLLGKKSN